MARRRRHLLAGARLGIHVLRHTHDRAPASLVSRDLPGRLARREESGHERREGRSSVISLEIARCAVPIGMADSRPRASTAQAAQTSGLQTRSGHRLARGLVRDLVRGLATGVKYKADGKHKDHPSPNGEWDYVFRAEGTKCPRVPTTDWSRLQEALREAFVAGVVQWDERCVTFPVRAWIYLNGRLGEARLSNLGNGE